MSLLLLYSAFKLSLESGRVLVIKNSTKPEIPLAENESHIAQFLCVFSLSISRHVYHLLMLLFLLPCYLLSSDFSAHNSSALLHTCAQWCEEEGKNTIGPLTGHQKIAKNKYEIEIWDTSRLTHCLQTFFHNF